MQQQIPYIYEKETELLQWTPVQFVDAVLAAVNESAHSALDRLEQEMGSLVADSQPEIKAEKVGAFCIRFCPCSKLSLAGFRDFQQPPACWNR